MIRLFRMICKCTYRGSNTTDDTKSVILPVNSMKRLFPLINIFLISAISFLSVDTMYNVVTAEFNTVDWPKPIISTSRFKPATSEAPPLAQYSAIVKRNIFQTTTNSVAPAKEMIVENIKPSERDLKLWGTVVGDDPAKAYAIIEETGNNSRRKKQSLYRRGDSVQGTKIKKILREKIILSADGKNEILYIARPQSSRRIPANRTAYNRSNRQPIRQKRILRSSHIQKAIGNIDTIMSQANIRPHSEGFKITRIRPSSIFRRMGLRNGDIITAVGRRPVNSVNDAIDILQDLTAGRQTSLKLKRRGRTRIIDYRIR
jgi:general secretion pathway protein C